MGTAFPSHPPVYLAFPGYHIPTLPRTTNREWLPRRETTPGEVNLIVWNEINYDCYIDVE